MTATTLTDHTSIVVGGAFEELDWYMDSPVKNDGIERYERAYTELVYRPSDRLRLAAGAQYNNSDGANSNVSPRLVATFKFQDNWGAKLLYGRMALN